MENDGKVFGSRISFAETFYLKAVCTRYRTRVQ